MANFLKPHSKEWFDQLEKLNPAQAAQTKQIINLAGTEDICSICGDEESKDYKLESSEIAPGAVSSLRLCNDCVQIRNNMHGENYVPFTH